MSKLEDYKRVNARFHQGLCEEEILRRFTRDSTLAAFVVKAWLAHCQVERENGSRDIDRDTLSST
jgi:hypothetical protein